MLAAAQVLAAIADTLSDAAGFVPGVHTGRAYPLAESDLPACKVFAGQEEIEPIGIGYPLREKHTLQVLAEIHVRDPITAEADLHTHTAAALTAIYATAETAKLDPLAGCTVTTLGIEREFAAEGEAAVAKASITFQVQFRTFSNAPETLI